MMMSRLVPKHTGHSRRLLLSLPQRRTLSETTTASVRRVISRRAWQRHVQKHPPPKTSGTSAKTEEKPWPKSLQLLGYSLSAVFIPYSIAWFLASNGSARALVHSEKLNDALRHYFGQPEDDGISFYDEQQGQEALYQLDGELAHNQRIQQALVEALVEAPVKARVRVDEHDDFVETVLPGATLARSKHVLQQLGREEGSVVAIDFGNVVVDENNNGTGQEGLYQDNVEVSQNENEYPVTRQTNIYSLWHYMGIMAAAPQDAATKMSSSDVEVSRLEHTIQILQHDLQDVNCTRDRDDMQRELKESKAALRNLKWRKRLGFVSS